jgi:hypothetical protein
MTLNVNKGPTDVKMRIVIHWNAYPMHDRLGLNPRLAPWREALQLLATPASPVHVLISLRPQFSIRAATGDGGSST